MSALESKLSRKHLIVMVGLAAAFLAVGGRKADAQAHEYGQPRNPRHERADFKDHQRQERRDYGSRAVRDHQRQESRAFKYEERQERSGYYGGYGYPPYGGGQYGGTYGGYGYSSGQVHRGDNHSSPRPHSGHGSLWDGWRRP